MNVNFENLPEYRPTKSIKTFKGEDARTAAVDNDQKKNYAQEKTFVFQATLPSVTVFDVAAYILKKTGPLTTMKLHKLLYYCQAWSLVWDEKPLYNESIEAWANGPVIKSLFAFHRGVFTLSSISIGNPDNLSSKQKETVDAVLNFYGPKTTQWLIELTHLEEPWKNARMGLSPTDRGNNIISHDSIAQYYSAL